MLAPQDAELTLAALFLEPTERRREALRSAGGRGLVDPEAWLACVEMHGVLPLVHRNVNRCGVELPTAIGERLAARVEALRDDARSDRLTLLRVLAAAADEAVDVLLLKGTSLTTDLYPDPFLRSQADLDVLVRPSDVRTLVGAAAKAGLVPGPRQLPCWWYRCTHYHLKLDPTSNLLREVEVHWELHSPATLYTAEHSKLWERARPVKVGEWRAFTLDPVDRFLHHATHLVRHAREHPVALNRRALVAILGEPRAALRLKWLLDLLADAEVLCTEVDPAALAGRAERWGAGEALAHVLHLLGDGFLKDEAARWAEGVCSHLAPPPAHAQGEIRRSDGPLPALDLRREALSDWPRWFWPPRRYLERRYGTRWSTLHRLTHAVGVGARSAGALVLAPLAFLGRALLEPRRRGLRSKALGPDAVLELVMEWRSLPLAGPQRDEQP